MEGSHLSKKISTRGGYCSQFIFRPSQSPFDPLPRGGGGVDCRPQPARVLGAEGPQSFGPKGQFGKDFWPEGPIKGTFGGTAGDNWTIGGNLGWFWGILGKIGYIGSFLVACFFFGPPRGGGSQPVRFSSQPTSSPPRGR